MQSHVAVEERDLRRLPEGLLERTLGLARRPVLVVALGGKIDINTVCYISVAVVSIENLRCQVREKRTPLR